MTRGTRRLAVVALWPALLASGAGCYRQLGAGDDAGNVVALAISNRGFFDVNVYAVPVAGAPPVRLGTVTGFSSRTLRVRDYLLQAGGALVLQLHAIGTRSSWTSPSLLVDHRSIARLDINIDSQGNMDQTAFYLRGTR